MKKIILDKYINRKFTALVGRDNGEHLLKILCERKINFSDLEKKHEKIEIIIPDRIQTMNKSYFLGLFETSIQSLGKEGFLQKYIFNTTPHILSNIAKYIDSGLLRTTMEEILNAQ